MSSGDLETPDEAITVNPLTLLDDKDQQALQRLYLYSMLAAKTLSLTVEVFFRREFGERYMGALSFFGAFVSMLSLVMGSIVLGSFFSDDFSLLMVLHGIAFLVVCSLHLVAILKRIKNNIRWHSRYSGIPLQFWQKLPWPRSASEHTIKRFLEPGLIGLLAFVISPVDSVYSLFLWFAASAMFIRANLEHLIQYGRMLDAIDSQIDAEEMNNSVIKGRQPAECRGSRLAGVIRPGQVRLKAPQAHIGNEEPLDSRLREMMKNPDGPQSEIESGAGQ